MVSGACAREIERLGALTSEGPLAHICDLMLVVSWGFFMEQRGLQLGVVACTSSQHGSWILRACIPEKQAVVLAEWISEERENPFSQGES